jgi:hypothetical protein
MFLNLDKKKSQNDLVESFATPKESLPFASTFPMSSIEEPMVHAWGCMYGAIS